MYKWIFIGFVALGFASTVDLLFFNFLPSAAVYDYKRAILLLAVASIALVFALNWTRWKFHVVNLNRDQPTHWWHNSPSLMAITAGFFIVFIVQLSTMRLLPHLIVAATGQPGVQEFVVEDVSKKRNRLCPRGVTVIGPPFGSNWVCRLSSGFRSKLSQGSTIVVYGKKSWAGLIPDTVGLK